MALLKLLLLDQILFDKFQLSNVCFHRIYKLRIFKQSSSMVD